MPQSLWLVVLIKSPRWALRANLWVNNWLLLIPVSARCCVGQALLGVEIEVPLVVSSGKLLSLFILYEFVLSVVV